jgi:3-oxoacyl-[acyl-carrier protein] reductase
VSLIEPGKTGSDMVEESPSKQRDLIHKHDMLRAEDIAVAVHRFDPICS